MGKSEYRISKSETNLNIEKFEGSKSKSLQARHVAPPRDVPLDGSAVPAPFLRQSRRVMHCAAEPRNEQKGAAT